MAAQFYPLTVAAVQPETNDSVSVVFSVPDPLKELFQFAQGQYINLRTTLGGEEVRRSYSLCAAPYEQLLRIGVKKQPGGVFSTYLNEQLKAGDVLEVMPPQGKFFTPLDPQQQKSYVFIAAGSGITPILSLLKETLHTEPRSTCTLLYGNRNRGSILFFEELEALKNKYMNRFRLIHILSREKTDAALHFGRINAGKLQELEKLVSFKEADEVFVCGPEDLIHTVRDYLEQEGMERKHIHFELFGTGARKPKQTTAAGEAGGPVSHITVQLDGRQFSFDLPLSSDTTLLDAAAAQGADVPYACKGGVCCTCKARLLEGEVQMDVHWGLDHEEIEQGYILTCQAHPKTETVVVDFDVK
ncbi:MAG TPA: phenylacetate-CoA oxygenase/reductase subunit PaaK [Lacibacter sp.]|nr:phenylacetate-CoA oxygenase/reductase subunit PaaK [Lacibacter sp.]HMO88559.1 phenylacetate-CoA oxygenase/reductase subunit PaaK [Lacibacter sp.]HMP86026.1 phenylacetate-CoA oxygenase/reductase subunit PaaK [Lacibacter sp.]